MDVTAFLNGYSAAFSALRGCGAFCLWPFCAGLPWFDVHEVTVCVCGALCVGACRVRAGGCFLGAVGPCVLLGVVPVGPFARSRPGW